MAIRFPKANTWFHKLTDTNLLTYASNIRSSLAGNATFPTPPVLPAALLVLVNAYQAALALATGPGAGKINTANKNTAKLELINALRQDAQYVNQIIIGLISTGTSYDDAAALILTSGYQLAADPVPAGPLPAVMIRKSGSYTKGQYYILVEKVVNAKAYAVKVIDNTASTAFETAFPTSRMTLTGLVSGHEYTFAIAAIGSNPTRNFATQITGAIII